VQSSGLSNEVGRPQPGKTLPDVNLFQRTPPGSDRQGKDGKCLPNATNYKGRFR
jgi:hypothetical protein